ncbi:MAG: ribosome small subunit-dependent GTPase A [Anaerolineae bacterium]|nr:ribosome small subunit-dependent GTPase A [Anaerolineae bacterium]
MTKSLVEGIVIRLRSGFYTIQTGTDIVTCSIRGRLKRNPVDADRVAIGDRVLFSMDHQEGAIEEVLERRSALVRMAPSPRGLYQQVLLANADQVLLIFACAHPEPHLRMLDRFLVICEKQGIAPVIVANKVDLVGLEQAEKMFSLYPPIGYPVYFTSAVNRTGIDELAPLLKDKITAFAGPSGAGKSSLLNAIQPDLGAAVSEVSSATERGRHTTVVRQLYQLQQGGYVADLPGLRSLALWDTQPEELDGYFPDLRDLVAHCQYNNCTHQSEPGCAVRQAVDEGRVHPERYESYLRMRQEKE